MCSPTIIRWYSSGGGIRTPGRVVNSHLPFLLATPEWNLGVSWPESCDGHDQPTRWVFLHNRTGEDRNTHMPSAGAPCSVGVDHATAASPPPKQRVTVSRPRSCKDVRDRPLRGSSGSRTRTSVSRFRVASRAAGPTRSALLLVLPVLLVLHACRLVGPLGVEPRSHRLRAECVWPLPLWTRRCCLQRGSGGGRTLITRFKRPVSIRLSYGPLSWLRRPSPARAF